MWLLCKIKLRKHVWSYLRSASTNENFLRRCKRCNRVELRRNNEWKYFGDRNSTELALETQKTIMDIKR